MTNFSLNPKNPIFGPFPKFLEQKKFFPKTPAVTYKFIKVSNTMPKFKEI